MDQTLQMIITVVCAVLASSGFWAFIQRRGDKKDLKTQLLLGLAHDRIMYLGMHYISRVDENGQAWITKDEYENFYNYLYKPYENVGGNGSAKRLKMEVDKLPVRDPKYMKRGNKI